MPTYEYACQDCGEHLEIVQSFKDEPLSVCGSCGGRLRKVFSAAGIIFKGSGYYVTDSRKKKSGSTGEGSKSDKTDKTEKPASSAPEKSGSSGPDTTPKAPKAESA